MINPPLTNLMKKVDCRYSLVIMASKRARQLMDGASPLIEGHEEKPVTQAVLELYNDKLRVEYPEEYN